MERLLGKIYTCEFKLEAARLVELGQRVAEAARSLGLFEQTLSNWIEAHKSGKPVANGRGATHSLPKYGYCYCSGAITMSLFRQFDQKDSTVQFLYKGQPIPPKMKTDDPTALLEGTSTARNEACNKLRDAQ